MRSAIVVLPVCASMAAGALFGFQLRARTPPGAVIVAPLPVAVTPVSLMVVPMPVAPPAPGPYARPVGGQFLDGNVLLAYPDMPPALLDPHTGDDAFRFEWRYKNLAGAMARELADAIDDACPHDCDPTREARRALQRWLDADMLDEKHTLTRTKSDDPVAPTFERRLKLQAWSGALTLEVECLATSDYRGMNGWNDAVACTATLLDHGRALVTYAPLRRTELVHGSWLEPVDEWDQRVTLPAAELVIRTGGQRKRGPSWTTR